MTLRLVVADDNKEFCKSVRDLLAKEPDLKVVGEGEDGQAAIELVNELDPDVVIMDVVMPNMNGVKATREIVSSRPRVKVIALSLHADKGFVEAMRIAGASGYVLKDHMSTELISAIRAVVSGQTYFSPELARSSR